MNTNINQNLYLSISHSLNYLAHKNSTSTLYSFQVKTSSAIWLPCYAVSILRKQKFWLVLIVIYLANFSEIFMQNCISGHGDTLITNICIYNNNKHLSTSLAIKLTNFKSFLKSLLKGQKVQVASFSHCNHRNRFWFGAVRYTLPSWRQSVGLWKQEERMQISDLDDWSRYEIRWYEKLSKSSKRPVTSRRPLLFQS